MTEKTYIRRSKHDKQNPYFMMRSDTAQNKDLSYDALGLLAYLLSKPDDWRVQINDLKREDCGRDKARNILDELVAKGYAKREDQGRDPKSGRFIYGDYEVSEFPIFLSPHTEKPYTENPLTVKPYTENPTLQSIESDKVSNNQIQKTKKALASNATDKPITPFIAMKNAIHAAFGYDREKTTELTWSLIGKAASELLAAGAKTEDVKGLYAYCSSLYDNFKARALVSNWEEYQKICNPILMPPPVEPVDAGYTGEDVVIIPDGFFDNILKRG